MDDFSTDDSGVYEAKDYEWIVRNPQIKGGSPTIRGTRLCPYAIRSRLNRGDTIEDLTDDFPHLTEQMIGEAISYAEAHPIYPQR